jgi:hypothetical protein
MKLGENLVDLPHAAGVMPEGVPRGPQDTGILDRQIGGLVCEARANPSIGMVPVASPRFLSNRKFSSMTKKALTASPVSSWHMISKSSSPDL